MIGNYELHSALDSVLDLYVCPIANEKADRSLFDVRRLAKQAYIFYKMDLKDNYFNPK